ncbi:MAG: hypothetical protein EOP06_02735 [Proteobacteria bacterium]|nr:MAG: hypothetical protein EOP06_02735 [Pseudomonadota bacterium]
MSEVTALQFKKLNSHLNQMIGKLLKQLPLSYSKPVAREDLLMTAVAGIVHYAARKNLTLTNLLADNEQIGLLNVIGKNAIFDSIRAGRGEELVGIPRSAIYKAKESGDEGYSIYTHVISDDALAFEPSPVREPSRDIENKARLIEFGLALIFLGGGTDSAYKQRLDLYKLMISHGDKGWQSLGDKVIGLTESRISQMVLQTKSFLIEKSDRIPGIDWYVLGTNSILETCSELFDVSVPRIEVLLNDFHDFNVNNGLVSNSKQVSSVRTKKEMIDSFSKASSTSLKEVKSVKKTSLPSDPSQIIRVDTDSPGSFDFKSIVGAKLETRSAKLLSLKDAVRTHEKLKTILHKAG